MKTNYFRTFTPEEKKAKQERLHEMFEEACIADEKAHPTGIREVEIYHD